jgi:hypothetical protein
MTSSTSLKILLILLLAVTNTIQAQVVNGYAKVTGISSATLTLSNVDESADTFEDDEWVVLIQVQDDVIGTATNSATFGSLGSIESTGLHEIRQIDSHTEVLGVPSTITLKNVPNFTYNTGPNSSVQIISFRDFGSPDYTTTADMSALPWDGNIGGVLAVFVEGTLTLGHNLNADEDGFNGAATNVGGSTGCSGASNYRVATNDNHADKGEGIYKATDLSYAAGRAKILTGGGGGNSHNAGGGGGGNYTAGGLGGPGWPTCSPSAGGMGGLDMSGEILVGRIFMGGGGGAGEGNNGFATDGKNGGGIILIKASEIESVACAGISISANGGSVPGTGGNDGGGGGGAGGTIVFEVETWSIDGACPLTISANGGNGGNVNTGATHGGGGGGGQGAIFFSDTQPTTNITTETNVGDGGCNNNSDPCTSQAGAGAGVDGMGIQDILTGPLPIELISFTGEIKNSLVQLDWTTESERNNAFFTVERSINGMDWNKVIDVSGAGNSLETLNYTTWDLNPVHGVSYYRLKQTDFNGDFEYSDPITIDFNVKTTLLYPNPTKDILNIFGADIGNSEITIMDALGKTVILDQKKLTDNHVILDIGDIPSGIYIVLIEKENKLESHRVSRMR